ncbi:MAG: UTP--glucose-1-phosphate uridylyltransferase GalU [bacterium]|nr:MAG: UTP--glucose-1-phosphate uridylyltransferase GalU [bacterium]
MKVRKVVIPAAGLGSRFLPATKTVPKELFPLVDRPLIHEVVAEAVASGISDLILVTAQGKSAIEDYFDVDQGLESFLERKGDKEMLERIGKISRMIRVGSVRQKEPLGLGHAVLCAWEFVGEEPFAVMLPDDVFDGPSPCLAQLLAVFSRTGKTVVALEEVPDDQAHKYGIIEGREVEPGLFHLESLVEKPAPGTAPSSLAVTGRYVLVPDVFRLLESQGKGFGGEIQLTDALNSLAGSDTVYGVVFKGIRYDAGDKLGFIKANINYALKDDDLGPRLAQFMADRLSREPE